MSCPESGILRGRAVVGAHSGWVVLITSHQEIGGFAQLQFPVRDLFDRVIDRPCRQRHVCQARVLVGG